jgi:hypothetical protein
MYSWATPEYLLYNMSLQQWAKYYKGGWESRKTNAQMFWGVLGEALSGKDGAKKSIKLDEFRKYYPEGTQTEQGYTVTR